MISITAIFQQTEEPCSSLEKNKNNVCRVWLCTPVTPAQRQSTANSKPTTVTQLSCPCACLWVKLCSCEHVFACESVFHNFTIVKSVARKILLTVNSKYRELKAEKPWGPYYNCSRRQESKVASGRGTSALTLAILRAEVGSWPRHQEMEQAVDTGRAPSSNEVE